MTTARASVPAASMPSPPFVARGTAAPPPPTPPPTTASGAPQPTRRVGVVAGVHVGQIFCWQLAAALVVASLGRHIAFLIAASVVALLLIAFTVLRVRRRWFYQWLGLRLRFAGRRRSATVGADRRLAFLDLVVPGAAVTNVELDGEAAGVIEHVGGVATILELTSPDGGLISERPVTPPSPATLLPLAEAGGPSVSVQLVTHVTPAPALIAGNSAAANSYRQLTGGQVPAQRRAWLALQLGRTAAGYSDESLRRALANSARRMVKRLRREGIGVRILDSAEALNTLAQLGHVDTSDLDSVAAIAAAAEGATIDLRAFMNRNAGGESGRNQRPVAYETWDTWWSESVPQACFRIRRWADLSTPQGRAQLTALAATPSVATTVSLAVRRLDSSQDRTGEQRESIAVEAIVRVAGADAASLERVSRTVAKSANQVGATLERLDGEQGYGVAATLPLGGFLP